MRILWIGHTQYNSEDPLRTIRYNFNEIDPMKINQGIIFSTLEIRTAIQLILVLVLLYGYMDAFIFDAPHASLSENLLKIYIPSRSYLRNINL